MGLKRRSGPPALDPLECVGKHMVLNYEEKPVKVSIEKALGDEKYIVRLGDDSEEVLTYGQII